MYRPSINNVKNLRIAVEFLRTLTDPAIGQIENHIVRPLVEIAHMEQEATDADFVLQSSLAARELAHKVEPTVHELQQDLHPLDHPQGNEAPDKESPDSDKTGEKHWDEAADLLEEANRLNKELSNKMDARLAADAIEKATDEVNKEISAESEKYKQEVADLDHKFDKKREGKEAQLKAHEDSFFERKPGLSQHETELAEEAFGNIRKDELGKIDEEYAKERAEIETRHEPTREELEEKRRELEGTRAER